MEGYETIAGSGRAWREGEVPASCLHAQSELVCGMVFCRMQARIRMDELRAVSVSGALFQADEADLYREQEEEQ